MRNVVYLVATTLDGFIARKDGSFQNFVWNEAFGSFLMENFPETFPARLRTGTEANRTFDTVLMGRATYEVGLREGITSPYPTLDQYLFSRTLESSPDDAVTLVKTGTLDRVKELKEKEGKSIWLCGGSELAGDLYAAWLIDKLILKVNPVVFGEGKSMFGRAVAAGRLMLRDIRYFESGHLLASYSVTH